MFGKIYKVVFCFLGAGVVFAIVVLGLYFYTFQGDLSHNPKEWGVFGSLLGGVFTLCSALATIGALLFVNKENAENRSVINQQTQALAFEQYVKHRDLFFQIMNDTAKDCSRDIEHYRLDELYKKIFPQNNPTRIPMYAVESMGSNGGDTGSLPDMVSAYKRLGDQLTSFDPACALLLLSMMELLHIRSLEPPENGDLVYCEVNTGINVYNLGSKVDEVYRLLNAILFFTGNDEIENLRHHANSGLLKLSLIKYYARRTDNIYVRKEGGLHRVLEDVYLIFSDGAIPVGQFEETRRRIAQGFSDSSELSVLMNNIRPFIKCYQKDCRKAENNEQDSSDKDKEFVREARGGLDNIIKVYQLGKFSKMS